MAWDTQVAVFGEALVDDFGSVQVVGGAPFNVARHLAGLGLTPLMLTRIGNDPAGELVRAEFSRFGMDTSGLQAADEPPTGRVLVHGNGKGHHFDILPQQAYDHIDAATAANVLAHSLADVVYFGTLAQRSAASRSALQAVLQFENRLHFLDLNLRDGQYTEACVFDALVQAHVVKVNEEELAQLFDWYSHTCPSLENMACESVRMACAALMDNFSLHALLVTLGPRGAVYYGVDGACVSVAGADVPYLADTVGAGDAFAAVILLGRALEWPLTVTMERANEFAADVCSVRGAVPDDLAFYAGWREHWEM